MIEKGLFSGTNIPVKDKICHFGDMELGIIGDHEYLTDTVLY